MLNGIEVPGYALLFDLHEIERNRVRVVGLEELRTLIQKPALASYETFRVGEFSLPQTGDLLQDHLLRLEPRSSPISTVR